MMKTRAESLLLSLDEISPYLIYGGIGALSTAAHLTNAAWQAKRRTREKVAGAGMGGEHRQAKQDLHGLRMQHSPFHTSAQSSLLKQKLQDQKAKIRDIESRGLHQYHSTLGQNPAEHAAAVQREKGGM